MINLISTTDKLQLVTSAAGDIDVVVSWGTATQANPPVVSGFGREVFSIVTATTTDILPVPGASQTKTPEEMSIRNASATVTNVVTLLYYASGTAYEIDKWTLLPGESVSYIKGIGFFQKTVGLNTIRNQSTADQALSAGVDTYLVGSALAIPANRPIAIGTRFHWRLGATKTAAGTAAWAVNVRFGTAGTVSDTARLTFTSAQLQTAAIDTGAWELRVIVRGPISASCIVAGALEFQHKLDVTGWSVLRVDAFSLVSSAFDITPAGLIVGISFAPGASVIPTFQVVSAELENT
jgi:hypothetical protein